MKLLDTCSGAVPPFSRWLLTWLALGVDGVYRLDTDHHFHGHSDSKIRNGFGCVVVVVVPRDDLHVSTR